MERQEEDADDFPVLRRHSSIRSLVNFKGKRKVRQEDSISYCGEFDTLSIAGEKGKFQDQLSTFRRRLSKKIGSVKDFSKKNKHLSDLSPGKDRRQSESGMSSLPLPQSDVLIHSPPSPSFLTRLEMYEEEQQSIKQSSRREVPICWINYTPVVDYTLGNDFSTKDLLTKLFSRVSTRYIASRVLSYLHEEDFESMNEVCAAWQKFVESRSNQNPFNKL